MTHPCFTSLLIHFPGSSYRLQCQKFHKQVNPCVLCALPVTFGSLCLFYQSLTVIVILPIQQQGLKVKVILLAQRSYMIRTNFLGFPNFTSKNFACSTKPYRQSIVFSSSQTITRIRPDLQLGQVHTSQFKTPHPYEDFSSINQPSTLLTNELNQVTQLTGYAARH